MKSTSSRTKQNAKEKTVVSPLFDNSADAVFIVDGKNTVCYANRTAAKIFQLKISDLLGTPFTIPIVADEVTTIPLPPSGQQQRSGTMRVVDVEWNGTKASLVIMNVLPKKLEAEPSLHQNHEMLQ